MNRLAATVVLLAGVGACLGNFEKVGEAGDGGSGGSGGSPGSGGSGAGASGGAPGGGGSGAGGSCEPFLATPPDDCDPSLLASATDCCVAGRDCEGGDCANGLCQPFELGGRPGEAISVLRLGNDVFWTTGYGNELVGAPIDGGAVSVFASTPNDLVTRATTDGTRIYWLDFGGPMVRAVDPAIGPSSLVELGDTTPHSAAFGGIVVRAGMIYWVTERDDVNMLDGVVWAMPSAGGTPTVVRQGGTPREIAATDGHVYWTDDEIGIRRVPVADLTATPETFVPGTSYYRTLKAHGGRIYWGSDDEVLSLDQSGGGGVTPHAALSGLVEDIAVDDHHIVALTSDDVIHRIPLGGGSPIAIATVVDAERLTMDCDAVYIARNAGPTDSAVIEIVR